MSSVVECLEDDDLFDDSVEKKTDSDALDVERLIRDLLGLAPASLTSLTPANVQDALLGLGMLMRRVLETTVSLAERPDLTLYLKKEKTARLHGFPDTQAANLATLFTLGLLRLPRWRNSRACATLEAARDDALDLPVAIEQRVREMSIDELIDELETEPKTRLVIEHTATYPLSVAHLLRSMLGLDPTELRFYRRELIQTQPPEDDALIGLDMLLTDALSQFKVMRERQTFDIRLMSELDAGDVLIPIVRAAHIATLLGASLYVATGQEVRFRAPRERSEMELATLKATAKMVCLDGSAEARRGFELIVDGCVHFGHGPFPEYTLAERYLADAEYELEPNQEDEDLDDEDLDDADLDDAA